jgi:hypothetical protein
MNMKTKSYTVTFWKCKECPIGSGCEYYTTGGIPDDCPFPINYVSEE